MSNSSLTTIHIEHLVYFVRGEKVMIDSDLATIYKVETKRLNEQVKRNLDRFPEDFMFQLTEKEWGDLQSQIATAKTADKNLKSQNATAKRRTLPYVFTEHGAVMLASVLSSPQAIAASVQIVRVFVKLREVLATHRQLANKLEDLEKKYDNQFSEVFAALKELMVTPAKQLILKKGIKE